MKKIVVTGLGALTCNGNNVDEFWNSIISGKIGYLDSKFYLQEDFPFPLCEIVKRLDFSKYLSIEEIKKLDRVTQLSLIASQMAVKDASIDFSLCDRRRIAVIMGTTCGANASVEQDDFVNKWFSRRTEISKESCEAYLHSAIANEVSKKFGLQGVSYLVGTACASGNHAIGEGVDLIRLGEADIVICGGAEALNLLPHLGFNSLNALASNYCAPYDINRDGIVIGEGAGVLVLESEEHALARNANIYAEISGWSLNCDAENITAPVEDGSRCADLILSCLKDANLMPNSIDYISLHGTGTVKNDLSEGRGIQLALKDFCRHPMVSSIKSMIGHTFGAAGALGSIASIKSINNQMVPINANLSKRDERLNLNLVLQTEMHAKVEVALSLSFGFGGCNVAVLFNKYKKA